MTEPIHWMGTREACERLGVTLRTLYRFIDEGHLPAYKMGRVIRVQAGDVDNFIERMRIRPGSLEHLYPEPRSSSGEGKPAAPASASSDDDSAASDAASDHADASDDG
jgi:excisionase family DNA binding protein